MQERRKNWVIEKVIARKKNVLKKKRRQMKKKRERQRLTKCMKEEKVWEREKKKVNR